MDGATAVQALAALAHSARLRLFRLLVRSGPQGLAAGALARALEIAPNTLTAQLVLLTQAGLATQRREGRNVIYAADFAAMGGLLAHLMEECCQGHPEICAPLAAIAARAACCAATEGRPA